LPKQIAFGRRAVAELLETGFDVTEIFFLASGSGEIFIKLKSTAETKGIRMISSSRTELDRITDSGNHQGIAAYYLQPRMLDIVELLDQISQDFPRPVIIIDGVEDPRNLGAIIRSAEVLGAGGIVLRKDRSAGITPLTVKASAGAAMWLPTALATNLSRTIDIMKKNGYWIYGLDSTGKDVIWDIDLIGKIGIVVGNEEKGISRLVKQRCDHLVRIPQLGKVASLNVSVSASLALSEWLRKNVKKLSKGLIYGL